jgi:hypothetical protein
LKESVGSMGSAALPRFREADTKPCTTEVGEGGNVFGLIDGRRDGEGEKNHSLTGLGSHQTGSLSMQQCPITLRDQNVGTRTDL